MSDDTTTTEAPVSEGVEAESTTAPTQPEATDQAEAEVNAEAKTTETNTNDDVVSWAEKKGLKLNPENETELKLAQMQREAEKKMHESTSQASELKNIINQEASQGNYGDDQIAEMRQQLQVMQATQAVNDFYAQNPDAKEFDADMAQLVQENPALANGGLEALYAVAKVRRLENGGEDAIKNEGKKQALEDLSLKQKVASTVGAATQKVEPSKGVTREQVREALNNHDISWLQEHKADIDALGR